MTAGHSPIQGYAVKRGAVSIQYNLVYEMHAARQAAGLTIAEFKGMPGNPIWMSDEDVWSKAHLIAWYRYNQMIPAVQHDAAARESERQSRIRSMSRR